MKQMSQGLMDHINKLREWSHAKKAGMDSGAMPEFNIPADAYTPCPCGSGHKYKFCCRPFLGRGKKK